MKEKFTDFWEKGMYKCANCGEMLFESEAKFKSGTECGQVFANRCMEK